jgi:hypothetical protein
VSAYVPTNYFSDQLPLLKLTLQSHGRWSDLSLQRIT